jgi:hypothetical protein
MKSAYSLAYANLTRRADNDFRYVPMAGYLRVDVMMLAVLDAVGNAAAAPSDSNVQPAFFWDTAFDKTTGLGEVRRTILTTIPASRQYRK